MPLAADDLYYKLLILQVLLYLLAVLGWWLERLGFRRFGLGPLVMFVALNITTLRAWWDILGGALPSNMGKSL